MFVNGSGLRQSMSVYFLMLLSSFYSMNFRFRLVMPC
jgi:hypothetical protein